MKTVLVTGAAGYIGSVLCQDLLAEGFKVIALDKLIFGQSSSLLPCLGHPNFEFHWTDVTWSPILHRYVPQADIIIPLAALVGAPLCDMYPGQAYKVNQDQVVQIVEIARQQKNLPLILLSNTNSGYGETDGESFVTEEDELKPISIYGQTKCEAEKAVLDYIRGITFRLATVFGASPRPRLDLMVNNFVYKLGLILDKQVSPEEQHVIFEPHFKRNFVHVRDVSRAFIWAIDHHEDMIGAYNLGNPDCNMSKMELAEKICEVLKIDKNAIRIGDGQDPDKRNYIVSNKKILSTGFKFQFGLEQGIKEVYTMISQLYAYNVQLDNGMGNV